MSQESTFHIPTYTLITRILNDLVDGHSWTFFLISEKLYTQPSKEWKEFRNQQIFTRTGKLLNHPTVNDYAKLF